MGENNISFVDKAQVPIYPYKPDFGKWDFNANKALALEKNPTPDFHETLAAAYAELDAQIKAVRPEESPVTTMSLSRGISTEMFLRL